MTLAEVLDRAHLHRALASPSRRGAVRRVLAHRVALLLRRTHGVDALRCPRCTGRMRVRSTITDTSVVKKILAHLRLPTEPLPRARARDPTGQESFDVNAAQGEARGRRARPRHAAGAHARRRCVPLQRFGAAPEAIGAAGAAERPATARRRGGWPTREPSGVLAAPPRPPGPAEAGAGGSAGGGAALGIAEARAGALAGGATVAGALAGGATVAGAGVTTGAGRAATLG